MKHANQHFSQIDQDEEFDCKSNCPFCNDGVICIQPQGVYYEYLEEILWINFKCLRCNQDFYEVWEASLVNYNFPDDESRYFDEYDDYTDAYYDERYEDFCLSLRGALQTGMLQALADYEYTIIEAPSEIQREFSNSPDKFIYPIYRRSTPELYDLFAEDD